MRSALILATVVALGCGSRSADADALARGLASSDASQRKAAAVALQKLGGDAKPALRALEKALLDTDVEVRLAVIGALVTQGEPARRGLALALTDAEPQVRIAAARGLMGLGPLATESIPNLIDALDDPSDDVAEAVRSALVAIGPPTIEALGREVVHGSTESRHHAAVALAALGAAALPRLMVLLEANSPEARAAALSAVATIAESATPPDDLDAALRKRFDDDNPEVAEAARRLHARLWP